MIAMAYSSSNPVLSNRFWNNISGYETMSYEGTMQKIGILFGTMVFSALMLITLGITVDMNILFVGTGIGVFGVKLILINLHDCQMLILHNL